MATVEKTGPKPKPRLDLSGSRIRHADLHDTDLAGAILDHADLRYANFSGAILDHADFSHANLKGANFVGASFSGTNLRGADLSDVDTLTREQLSQAKIDGATKLPNDLRGAEKLDS
jgi:uncharacterized protein YjbI with pentapeptide repeats